MPALCDDWLSPDLRTKADTVLGAHGLKRVRRPRAWWPSASRRPLVRLPPLEIRHATDDEAVRHIADINAVAYDSPLEVARQSAIPALFQGDSRGYVGFVDGKAVPVASVMRVDGIAYVAYVATLEEHRKRGYAEAVIRHGLAEALELWGLERTVLHASDAGHPVYLRMGYRDVTRFGFYMPDDGH